MGFKSKKLMKGLKKKVFKKIWRGIGRTNIAFNTEAFI